jgi:hypothetical protein
MNKRRETMGWSMVIVAAIALGLVVVWAAIMLAFSRLNLAPLYFDAAPYRQDDYSAEGVDVARLNPLDPALEQEVIFEDLARSSPVPKIKSTAPTNTPLPKPTNTHLPLPTSTSQPAPTNTSVAPSPKPTNTHLPLPTSTSQPAPTNTSAVPGLTHTPRPSHTPPFHTPRPSHTPPFHTPRPSHTPGSSHTPEAPRISNSYVKWGGSVTNLLPTLVDRLNRIIKADKTVANLLHELEKNLLLKIAIYPGLDLLDASCKFNPSQDGVSVSVGFICIPAIFTAPGD